jgi:hypothetical protein
MGNANWRRFAFGSRAKSPHIDVGKTIAAHIRDETPDVASFISVATLAVMCGKSESNVRRSRNVLEKLGELRIEHRPGRTDYVFINWDALEPPTGRELGNRARLPTGAPGAVHVPPSTARTGKKSAYPQARTPPTDGRAARLPTGDEPQGAPSDLGAPPAAGAVPPAASPPQLSGEALFVEAWDRRGISELTEATVAQMAQQCGVTVNDLYDLGIIGTYNNRLHLNEEAAAYRT